MELMGECSPASIQDTDGPTGFEGPGGLFEPIDVKEPAGTVGEIGLVSIHGPSVLQKNLN